MCRDWLDSQRHQRNNMERFLNKITCGDNCDLLGLLPRECIDLVVTSPPYDDLRTYGGHTWDFYGVAWQLKRVLKPGGVIVWVVADSTKDGSETGSSMEQALFFKRLGLNLHDTMIYAKAGQPRLGRGQDCRYQQQWEYMFVLSKGKPKTTNMLTRSTMNAGKLVKRTCRDNHSDVLNTTETVVSAETIADNFWFYGEKADGKGHPAIFPPKLAKDHVFSWSNPGDVVLDPFSGSGTTAKAAKELGRQYIGFEINPEYCTIGEARTA